MACASTASFVFVVLLIYKVLHAFGAHDNDELGLVDLLNDPFSLPFSAEAEIFPQVQSHLERRQVTSLLIYTNVQKEDWTHTHTHAENS